MEDTVSSAIAVSEYWMGKLQLLAEFLAKLGLCVLCYVIFSKIIDWLAGRLGSRLRKRANDVTVVNYAMNRELLEDVPHRRFLDLAGILYCDVRNPAFSNAAVLIQNSIAEKWGVSADWLFETARRNMLLYEPAEIWPMGRMLADLRGIPDENTMPEFPLYVLTNKSRMFGAACMMYPDVFKNATLEIKGDFYVLPSSIHEVLLLPSDNVFDAEGLGRLVREINENQVEPYEVLSNNVYYYDSEKEELGMA